MEESIVVHNDIPLEAQVALNPNFMCIVFVCLDFTEIWLREGVQQMAAIRW